MKVRLLDLAVLGVGGGADRGQVGDFDVVPVAQVVADDEFRGLPAGAPGEGRVDIRGKEVPVRVVKFPFVREGKVQDGI